jgi:hypothetical protein
VGLLECNPRYQRDEGAYSGMISRAAYGGLAGALVADLRSVEVRACFVTQEHWNVARDFHGR